MFEKIVYYCPGCNWEFQDELRDGQDVTCPSCARHYRVLIDEPTGRASFLEADVRPVPEPLYLPRGSIRALVSLSLAGACWALVGLGRQLPESLLALLLTVLGYYFGFRKSRRAAESAVHDATHKTTNPLFLPGGAIRVVLLAGFVICAGVLLSRGQLTRPGVLDFFLIVAGLLAGHIYGQVTAADRASAPLILINHLKGLAVLLAAAALAVIYLAGHESQLPPTAVAILAAVVSFYFGSR